MFWGKKEKQKKATGSGRSRPATEVASMFKVPEIKDSDVAGEYNKLLKEMGVDGGSGAGLMGGGGDAVNDVDVEQLTLEELGFSKKDLEDPVVLATLQGMNVKGVAPKKTSPRRPGKGKAEAGDLEKEMEKSKGLALQYKKNGDIANAKKYYGIYKELKAQFEAKGKDCVEKTVVETTNLLGIEEIDNVQLDEADLNDPDLLDSLKELGWKEESPKVRREEKVESPQSKLLRMKKEMDAYKKEALAFKREGNIPMAKKSFQQFKDLRVIVEALTQDTADEGTAVTRPPPAAHRKVGESERAPSVPALPPSVDDAIESVTLTEDDYNDPELLSQLQDIGFVESPGGGENGGEAPPPPNAVMAAKGPCLDLSSSGTASLDSFEAEMEACKQQAIAFKKAGNIEAAKATYKKFKEMREHFSTMKDQGHYCTSETPSAPPPSYKAATAPAAAAPQRKRAPPPDPRADLQTLKEKMNEMKRKAVAARRGGDMKKAKEYFRQYKQLKGKVEGMSM